MEAPAKALELARHFEGLYLRTYLDPVGVPTIGYGHCCKADQPPIDRACADQWLVDDMTLAAYAVVRLLPGVGSNFLTELRLAALADFVFNLGALRFQSSTLRRKLLDYDEQGAADELPKWRMGKDPKTGIYKPLPGLVLRRAAEREMFLA